MKAKVLLLDHTADLASLRPEADNSYGAVLCLFWAAPDTKKKISESMGCECYALSDLVPDVTAAEKETYLFVKGLCGDGPSYKGIPFRQYLSQSVYQELLTIRILIEVVGYLRRLAQDLRCDCLCVDYALAAENGDIIRRILALGDGSPSLVPKVFPGRTGFGLPQSARPPFLRRMVRHLEGAITSGLWKMHIWNGIEKIDRELGLRTLFWKLKPSVLAGKKGILFFSSYLNNSKILAEFEQAMPSPVHWIVSTYYARKAIASLRRPMDWLWQFSSAGPSERLTDDIEHCFSSATPLESDLFTVWKSVSKIRGYWKTKWFGTVQAMTRCWEACLDSTDPRLVVVANQWGIEGWFSALAKRRGIPVLQIMHGVIGGFMYTRTPVLSDCLIVSGEFWKRLWPEGERRKIMVYNPTGLFPGMGGCGPREKSREKRQLTFFSWPLTLTPFYNFSEFSDSFISMLSRIAASGRFRICVRTHPLENPVDLLRRWRRICGTLPPELIVESGKEANLSDTLARTDVALMYRSTVMLNCISQKIPIVMPGWVDFGWDKSLMTGLAGLYLARDFCDLEDKLLAWLSDPPGMPDDEGVRFVRPEGKGTVEFQSLVESFTDGIRKPGPGREVFVSS